MLAMRPQVRANYDERHRLLEAGYRTVHLIPGGKTPEAVGWQRRGGNLFDIAQDFEADPYGNNGVQTGAALDGTPILALDLDRKELLDELRGSIDTDTTIVETAKGYHLWYRGVIGNHVKFRGHQGIDIRGRGGYVVAPWSFNAEKDFIYRYLTPLREPCKLALFDPDWFPDLRQAVKRRVVETAGVPDMERVFRYVDKAEPAVSGQGGHSRFYGLCCRTLRTFPWLNYKQLVQAMACYSVRCLPPWSPKEIEHKCQDAWPTEREGG
jgi:hypothetical protein